MKHKNDIKNTQGTFFFCPASDYLNQHNESGSHGKLSYEFIRHLAMKSSVKKMFGLVMMSMPVDPIPKTKIEVLINKDRSKHSLNDFDSLSFYLMSFFKYFRSKEYKEADIVHHIIPFKFGRTFNLFFLMKNKSKRYIIGPIVSPHISDKISSDEEYIYIEKKNISERLSSAVFNIAKDLSLFLFGKALFFLSCKTLQNADILFFTDNYSLNQHKQYLKKGQTTVLLDTGINVDVFKPAKKIILKKKSDRVKVLFVGRLTKRKGCEYLIRALKEVKDNKKNMNVHCNILGYGPLKNDLVNMVNELGLAKYVSFLDGVKNDELVKFYHATDIICIPALSDTFTVIKEGMASGKPIIVTEVCSHAERVDNGVNGYIIPPMDSHAIAKILLQLSNNPTSLNELSRNAPKTSSKYDWNNIADKYLRIIQEG